MIIKKVKINDNGFKGAAIDYYQEEEKNGKAVLVLNKKYPKNPIHLGLEKLFKDLRPHILAIYGIVYDTANLNDMAISQTTIDTVKADNGVIEIGGFKEVLDGKFGRLDSPKLQDGDDYEGFEDLNAIVTRILEETAEYIKGNVKVDDLEVAIRYIQAGKSKNVTMADVDTMTDEEKKAWATEFLESKYGTMVIHREDATITEEDGNEEFEEVTMEVEESIDFVDEPKDEEQF